MNIEVLKESLSEATYNALEEELKEVEGKLADLSKGEYVSVGKYNALETQLNNTQTLLDNKTSEYDELIAKAGDNDELKNQIETLKSTSQTEIENLKAEYEGKLKTAAVLSEITASGAIDPKDIIPHIKMDDVKIENEKTTGLSEQIEALKKSKPYLFNASKKGASGISHEEETDNEEMNRIRAVMGLPPIK